MRIARLRNPFDRASTLIAAAGLVPIWADPRARFASFELPTVSRSCEADVHFNLSHTRGGVAIAMAGAPVGVDLELIRSFPDQDAVALLVFAAEGVRALQAQADIDTKRLVFYRLWTLGEPYIKATGLGVARGLHCIMVTTEGAPRLLSATPGFGPPLCWKHGQSW